MFLSWSRVITITQRSVPHSLRNTDLHTFVSSPGFDPRSYATAFSSSSLLLHSWWVNQSSVKEENEQSHLPSIHTAGLTPRSLSLRHFTKTKTWTGMYPLCTIFERSSGQKMVLPQEGWVPGGHIALMRGKTTILSCIRLWRIVLRLRQNFHLQLVPQWHNELLEIVYFNDSPKPGTTAACIPLTSYLCCLPC
ncbi:uncharacterized protein TNCV_725131 [Trichonephila clavipes]|nr:uncharacterized protein TNCV_725131 [Trichonephila clavipes]